MGGGPGTSTNGGYGAEIDSADVVVRVNRLPSADFHTFLGSRTDILFKDQCHPESDGGFDVQFTGDGTSRCGLWEGDCPFDAIVFKGNTQVWQEECAGQNENNDDFVAAAHRSVQYYGSETELATNGVFGLRDFHGGNNGHKPTTGFHAVVTFALACKSLRLYGFGGTTSLDGHHIMESHGIREEHTLLSNLLNQTVWPTLDEMMSNAELLRAWAAVNVTNVC